MKLDLPGLESCLWEAACVIRGPVDAPKFKDYILPLIFLKRVSYVFEDEIRARRPRHRHGPWHPRVAPQALPRLGRCPPPRRKIPPRPRSREHQFALIPSRRHRPLSSGFWFPLSDFSFPLSAFNFSRFSAPLRDLTLWTAQLHSHQLATRFPSRDIPAHAQLPKPHNHCPGGNPSGPREPPMNFTKKQIEAINYHANNLQLIACAGSGKTEVVTITLKGVAVFDRKARTTDYKRADSGYISAWNLDEDYDDNCFVDCQMFYDFKKAPNLRALGLHVHPEEFKLAVESQPFPVRGYKRIAVKVVDMYHNESTVVKEIA